MFSIARIQKFIAFYDNLLFALCPPGTKGRPLGESGKAKAAAAGEQTCETKSGATYRVGASKEQRQVKTQQNKGLRKRLEKAGVTVAKRGRLSKVAKQKVAEMMEASAKLSALIKKEKEETYIPEEVQKAYEDKLKKGIGAFDTPGLKESKERIKVKESNETKRLQRQAKTEIMGFIIESEMQNKTNDGVIRTGDILDEILDYGEIKDKNEKQTGEYLQKTLDSMVKDGDLSKKAEGVYEVKDWEGTKKKYPRSGRSFKKRASKIGETIFKALDSLTATNYKLSPERKAELDEYYKTTPKGNPRVLAIGQGKKGLK